MLYSIQRRELTRLEQSVNELACVAQKGTAMETKIFIIDEMMGGGKTSAAINYMNNAPESERFIFVTPFLSEIEERVIPLCEAKNFVTPVSAKGETKLNSLVAMVADGRNIATTHSLFDRMTPKLAAQISKMNYTLIMDEVHESIKDFAISKYDRDILLSYYASIDEHTGAVVWDPDMQDYIGKFSQVKYMCDTRQLYCNGGTSFIRTFPPKIYTTFNKVIILTYMFQAQVLRCFYDLNSISYSRLYVERRDGEFFFTDKRQQIETRTDYRNLIHILNNTKMNRVGMDKYSLCVQWYGKAKGEQLQEIKNNMVNFFIHIVKGKSRDNMWTAFKNTKQALTGKGYTKGFVPSRVRATNKFRERVNVAYPINIFLDPCLKRFFSAHDIHIDEDQYAMSEMLQCLWRSAIRDGKEIWVYIPSARMRGLLEQWIEDNSPAADISNKEVV